CCCVLMMLVVFFFFFFQAEDGIRDFHVTGVQTCALPIWVKRVLAAKYWLGLNNYRPVKLTNLVNDLNVPAAKSLVQRLADAAVTVLKSDKRIQTFNKRIETAIVCIGVNEPQDFEKGLFVQVSHKKEFFITGRETEEEL